MKLSNTRLITLSFVLSIGLTANGQDVTNLSKALEIAIKKSPMTQMALADVDLAKASGLKMQSMYEPLMSLNSFGATGKGQMILPTLVMPTMLTSLSDKDSYGFSGALMWRPFTFGRAQLTRKSADAMTQMSKQIAARVSLDVTKEVRLAYSDALLKKSIVEAQESSVESAKQMEAVTKAQLDAGKVPQAFYLRAQAETASMVRELAMAKADAEMAMAMLREAMAIRQDQSLRLGEWDDPMVAPSSLQQALETALKSRPELGANKADSANARFKLDLARRAYLPDFALMAMADWMKPEDMNSMDGQKLAFVISLPVFDGKERKAAKDEAKAMVDKSNAEKRAIQNQIEREIAQAWAEYTIAPSVISASDAEYKASEEAYRVAVVRYESGKSILAEVADARMQWVQSKRAIAESQAFRQKAWTNLMRSIGTTL